MMNWRKRWRVWLVRTLCAATVTLAGCVAAEAATAGVTTAKGATPRELYGAGWSMVMDYMLNPLICTVWCAGRANQFAPGVPSWIWKIFFVLVFTLLNIRGIKTSARINTAMALLMGMVVVAIFIAAARYLFGAPHGIVSYLTPFYDPHTFSWGNLMGCTSIAVLTYIGFDGISTLSEEAENPRRNILLATVFTCLLIGVLSAAEVYVAQLIWPAREPFPLPGEPDRRLDIRSGPVRGI